MLMTQEHRSEGLQAKQNLVVFLLNHVHYAIAIEPIQQIIEMVTITPVLKTESWMEGMINYHGFSVPIVNLRRHFGMMVVPYRWHTPIILVNIGKHHVGLIVDEVLDVLTLPAEQITSPKAILPWGTPETPLLQGIIQTEENLTILIDLDHLFDEVQVRTLNIATSALSGKTTQSDEPFKAARKKRPSAPKAESTPAPTTEVENG